MPGSCVKKDGAPSWGVGVDQAIAARFRRSQRYCRVFCTERRAANPLGGSALPLACTSHTQSREDMDQQDRVSLFDGWAQHYDRSVQADGDFPFDGYERVLDEVARAARAQPGMAILDLGIGTGNLAARFVSLGCDVVSVQNLGTCSVFPTGAAKRHTFGATRPTSMLCMALFRADAPPTTYFPIY
jgi:hypothetical protein